MEFYEIREIQFICSLLYCGLPLSVKLIFGAGNVILLTQRWTAEVELRGGKIKMCK